MRRIMKLVATLGKYTDAQGQEKNRYLTVGYVFERPDGTRCHHYDCQPVGGDWNGWVNEYPLDEQRQQPKPKTLDNAFDNEPTPF